MGRQLAILMMVLCSCAPRAAGPFAPWSSPVGGDHPLVGRVFDVAAGNFVAPSVLLERAAGVRFVLLGEKHDNADHHRLQAWLIRGLVAAGRRPAVVFEMLDTSQRPALEAQRAASPGDVDALAAAVDWANSGWPDWALYRPVFAATFEADLEVVPGNLPPDLLASLRKRGLAALEPATRERVALDRALDPDARARLVDDIREGHCGMVPPGAVDVMVDMQRARDAWLADALLAANADTAVLIAGSGHVAKDIAVPVFLRHRAPAEDSLAVSFVETSAGARGAEAYGGGAFDFLVFTPRVDDVDPCERFREQLERMHQGTEGGLRPDREGPIP